MHHLLAISLLKLGIFQVFVHVVEAVCVPIVGEIFWLIGVMNISGKNENVSGNSCQQNPLAWRRFTGSARWAFTLLVWLLVSAMFLPIVQSNELGANLAPLTTDCIPVSWNDDRTVHVLSSSFCFSAEYLAALSVKNTCISDTFALTAFCSIELCEIVRREKMTKQRLQENDVYWRENYSRIAAKYQRFPAQR